MKIRKIIPMRDKVLVTDIESGDKVTKSGLIIIDDNGKDRGIRPRWARVWAVGKDITDLQVGQWILISHGRWSRGVNVDQNGEVVTIRQVEYPASILLVSDSNPLD